VRACYLFTASGEMKTEIWKHITLFDIGRFKKDSKEILNIAELDLCISFLKGKELFSETGYC